MHKSVKDSLELGSQECFSLKSVYSQSSSISEVAFKCSYQFLGAASAPGRLWFLAFTCLSGFQGCGFLWTQFLDTSKSSYWFSIYSAFFCFVIVRIEMMTSKLFVGLETNLSVFNYKMSISKVYFRSHTVCLKFFIICFLIPDIKRTKYYMLFTLPPQGWIISVWCHFPEL